MVFPISGGREIATFDDLTVYEFRWLKNPVLDVGWIDLAANSTSEIPRKSHGKNIGKSGEIHDFYGALNGKKYHL